MLRLVVFLLGLLLGATVAWADAKQDCKTSRGDAAIAACDLAIRENPRDAMAYIIRGVAYTMKGEDDRAIADYSKAIELDPTRATPYYDRALVYELKGDKDRAIVDYRRGLALDPSDPDCAKALKRLGASP